MALVYEVATLRSKIVAACRASFTPHRGACERGWTQQEAGACALTKWRTSLHGSTFKIAVTNGVALIVRVDCGTPAVIRRMDPHSSPTITRTPYFMHIFASAKSQEGRVPSQSKRPVEKRSVPVWH